MIPMTWQLGVIAAGIVALTLLFNMPSWDRSNWVDERTGPGDLDDEGWGLNRLEAVAGPASESRRNRPVRKPRRSPPDSPSRWFP
jgi:hypothetical protein